MRDTIETAIRRAIPDATVLVDSPDGAHWTAVVVSASFVGLSLVRQHQLVMGALRSEFDTERLHALELRTYTPERFRAEQTRNPLPVV